MFGRPWLRSSPSLTSFSFSFEPFVVGDSAPRSQVIARGPGRRFPCGRVSALPGWSVFGLCPCGPPLCGGTRLTWMRRIHVGDERSQFLRWLEDRNRSSADFYRRARAGIARHACFALANLERSEATDLDVLLLFQRVLDCIKECIHDAGAILLGNHGAGGAGDL